MLVWRLVERGLGGRATYGDICSNNLKHAFLSLIEHFLTTPDASNKTGGRSPKTKGSPVAQLVYTVASMRELPST